MLNEILNLEGVAILSKEQQKSVNGGTGSCAVLITNGDGEVLVQWGSKSEIKHLGGAGGGNRWCCSGCSTATWINSCNIC